MFNFNYVSLKYYHKMAQEFKFKYRKIYTRNVSGFLCQMRNYWILKLAQNRSECIRLITRIYEGLNFVFSFSCSQTRYINHFRAFFINYCNDLNFIFYFSLFSHQSVQVEIGGSSSMKDALMNFAVVIVRLSSRITWITIQSWKSMLFEFTSTVI